LSVHTLSCGCKVVVTKHREHMLEQCEKHAEESDRLHARAAADHASQASGEVKP
jgi:hypothetical protein